MAERTYAIIGAGALGGYYGGRLAHAGVETHFLLRSDYEHVRRHGMTVESTDGGFQLPRVSACPRMQDMPPCDVVLLTAKTTANAHLIPQLPAVVKPDGVVVVLQNGLGVEDAVAAVVGAERVAGGLCFLCSNRVAPGHIRHSDYGLITLGDYAPGGELRGITERIRAIGGDLESAGIPIALREDLYSARWHKLVWNVPFNGLAVLLNTETDQIMHDPAARRLAEDLMWEVVAGAKAVGKTIAPEFVEKMMRDTENMKPYSPSMYLDYRAGNPMEIETMYANPLRAAREAGVELPRIESIYRQLAFLDKQR